MYLITRTLAFYQRRLQHSFVYREHCFPSSWTFETWKATGNIESMLSESVTESAGVAA